MCCDVLGFMNSSSPVARAKCARNWIEVNDHKRTKLICTICNEKSSIKRRLFHLQRRKTLNLKSEVWGYVDCVNVKKTGKSNECGCEIVKMCTYK